MILVLYPLLPSPEQHLFQLSGYHSNKRGSPSVEGMEFHVGCHDLCGDICICSHTSPTAATEHTEHLISQTMNSFINTAEIFLLGLRNRVE